MVLFLSHAQAGEKPPLQSTGSFELGFRHVDVNGNEDKYMEDVNYTKGPRLFKLDFNVFPGKRGDQFFDLLNISASNLGGDPYEHLSVTLKKHRKYNFRYTRNRLTYFYKDIIKPLDESTPALSDAGDFHHFNFDHVFHRASFDFRVQEKAKLFFKFDRQYKSGENTTTRDVGRDEFELDRPFDSPRDDVKNDYTAGAEIWFDKVTLYVDETYRDYKNDNRVFLPGFSEGEDPEDQTELLTYDQSMPVAYQMPQTTVKANVRPHERVTLNGGYVYSFLEADLEYRQTTLGTDYDGSPIDETITGTGDFERHMHLIDADGAVDVNEMLTLIGAVSYKKFDQEGMLLIEEDETNVDGDFNSIGADAGATLYLNKMVSVTGGISYEEREVNGFAEEDAENQEDRENTTRTTFFGSATVRPDPRVNIFGEYERGVYDNPFTLISPSDYARYKVRLRAKPTPESNIVAVFLRREIDNDDSDADLTSNTISVRGSYKMHPVKLYGAYSRKDIDNDVRNDVTTLPGFGGGQVFPWESLYEANINQALAGIGFEAHENLTLGLHALIYTNSGSFELDKKEFSTYALVKCPAGYTLRFGYDREDYNEDAADFDDYDANIFTVGVGYDFKYD
jgi:predicted porin